MAGELQVIPIPYIHAATVYFEVRNAIGQIYNTSTTVVETYSTANLATKYGISSTEQGTASGCYVGTMPSALPAGIYHVSAFIQAGGSPAEGDQICGDNPNYVWTGSVVSAAESYLPQAQAGAPGGVFIAGTNAATTANITGNLSGSVGSVTGAVGSVTAAVTLSAGDSPVLQSGTATAGGASTITIQTALGTTADPVGCKIKITSGTGAKQERVITGYVNGTLVVTVDYPWVTNPDATSVYSILYDNAPSLNSALKIAGVVLTDTLTTYTGNTLQTANVATLITTVGVAGVGLTNLGDTRIANLDAAVSSRMATYTQPTGFLAATFPSGTVANTTNITAGTITTVTNLTNLPAIPANWLTAAGIAAGALNGKGDWVLTSHFDTIIGTPVVSVSADIAEVEGETDLILLATNTGVAPGAAGGLFIAGTNDHLTITNATTLTGNVSLGGTLGVTGLTTLGGLTTGALSASSIAVSGTSAFTGNVSMAAGLTITQSATNTAGLAITGNGTAPGISCTGGATGDGFDITGYNYGMRIIATVAGGVGVEFSGDDTAFFCVAGSNSGVVFKGGSGSSGGLTCIGAATGPGALFQGGGTSGDGIDIVTTIGHGVNIAASGTSKHGLFVTGGTAGVSDGAKFVAGAGGVDFRASPLQQLEGAFTSTVSSVFTVAALANAPGGGNVTVGGYAAGQDPFTLVMQAVLVPEGYTMQQAARILLAEAAGTVSGAPLAPVFHAAGGATVIISGTCDAFGNRLTSILTP